MATNNSSENRKRKVVPTAPGAEEQREGSRKIARIRGEVCCPVCEVTLWPGTLEQHYQQELARLSSTTPSLAHSKKRRAAVGSESSKEKKLLQRARHVLECVRRRQILFCQRSDSSSNHASASSTATTTRTCPVCACPLPLDEGVAEAHVTECLNRAGDGGSDSEDGYEEYTWCNVTRVRATSMLSPRARANMFDGTVISKGESSVENEGEVNVEDDETSMYGPPQFGEADVELTKEDSEDAETAVTEPGNGGEEMAPPHQQPQCLICMDSYQKPLVSVKCWHVYCERCWLKALGTKKVCPKCKDITSTSDLRKLFL